MTAVEPRLAIRAIRPLVSGLAALGHDPAPLLAATGIDERLLGDPEARVPMSLAVSLLTRAVEQTGDADLGLHLAEGADLGSFDVHVYAMLSSPTLGAGYERLSRYQRLIHDTSRVQVTTKGDRAVVRHALPGGRAAPRHTAEFLLASWVRVGRLATGLTWTPAEVRFAHARPADVREHGRIFGAPVRFLTGENALVLDAALLDRPCTRADPALLALLDRYAADLLGRAPRSESLADRARALLARGLRDGQAPGAAGLARQLRLSPRSLARHLAVEGTSYRALLDQLRQELTARYLGDERCSIAEAAFLVGFSELSTFYRAVRRWTGRTPAELRAGSQSAPGGPARPA